MLINKITPYNPRINLLQTAATKECGISERRVSCPFAPCSGENIKSAFLPAFGQFRKVGEAYITDRTTGEKVKADIKKEKLLNEFINYRLYVDKKVAGYMDMSVNDEFPEYNHDIPSYENEAPFESFPQIVHLRTLEGDKYSGIGTTLVNLAIEESKKLGKRGALWLDAEKGYMRTASKYRSDESPIPFYYKLGFRAVGKDHDMIKKLLKKKDYNMLPESQILYLTPKAAHKKNKYHEINYTLR